MRIFLSRCCISLFMLIALLSVTASYAASPEMNENSSNTQLVKDAFKVFSNINAKPEDFAKYFSPEFTQISDGHALNYQDFLAHVQAMHKTMKSIHLTFRQIAAEKNIVATHHIASGITQDGRAVKTEFFAFFTIKDHKIINCQEVSRMIQGDTADQNLSYRH